MRAVVFIVGGFVVLGVIAVAVQHCGDAPGAAGAGSATAQGSIGDAPPVTAIDLEAAYRANEVRADDLYRGKLVHVTGVVDKIAKDIIDHPVVTLRTNGAKGITCSFATNDPKLVELDRDSRVTLHCTGEGLAFGGVRLKDCGIDAVHGPPCEVWADNSGQPVHGECTRNCTGVVYRGYCDGPSDVVCCASSAPTPTVTMPTPPKPGRLEQAAGGQ